VKRVSPCEAQALAAEFYIVAKPKPRADRRNETIVCFDPIGPIAAARAEAALFGA
jgi:hypothetical protein